MTRPALLSAVLLLAALGAGAAPASLPASAFPKPDRPVAEIVSSTWSSEEVRDKNGEARQLTRALNVRPGMVIADIGSGDGYHTVRLARSVAPGGKVVAVDVQASALTRLRARTQRLGLKNVEFVQGAPHAPNLAPRSVDLAILVHMYHEIESPFAFLYNLAPALKAGGRVAVVDLDRPTERHGTPPALLRCEFAAVGWRQVSMTTLSGDLGYLAVYEPMERPQPRSIRPCPNRVRR